MKQILSNKLFMSLTLSDLISNFGDSLYYLVMMRYVLDIPQTTLAMSIIYLSEMIPLMTAIFTGDLADRTSNKISAILKTQLLRVGLYLGVAYLMSFEAALYLVLGFSLINLISDLAGQYESSLFIPVSLRVLNNEERESAMGFKQALLQAGQVIFLSSGSIFLLYFSYRQIALINSMTFLLSFLILWRITPQIKRLFIDRPLETDQKESGQDSLNFLKRLKLAYLQFRDLPHMMNILIIVALLNGVLAALNNLLVLSIDQVAGFVIGSATQTIALFPIVLLIGQLIGSLLAMSIFKHLGLYQELFLGALAGVFIYLSLWLGNVYAFFATIFFLALVSGAIGPKFNAYLMNHLPEERISLTMSSIGTLITSGVVIIGGVTVILMNFLSLKLLVVGLFVSMLCLTLYVIYQMIQRRKDLI